MSILDDCGIIDCALQIVDDLGLNISKVGIITRCWQDGLGSGTPSDIVEYLSPTPRISNISNAHSNSEGGTQKKGEIMLSMLSKKKYTKNKISCISTDENLEYYYYIDENLYEVVNVNEESIYYEVTLKRAKKRKLYL